MISLDPVPHTALRVTSGSLGHGRAIRDATFRAVATTGGAGDAAELTFQYAGLCAQPRPLASGEIRHQVGLKLRAQDTCNVIYVMWQLAPAASIVVSVKSNPGQSRHADCGARGYLPVASLPLAAAVTPQTCRLGALHRLRAEIAGDELRAWTDDVLVFHGRLPDEARVLTGPAGLRTDNVMLDLVALAAQRPPSGAHLCI